MTLYSADARICACSAFSAAPGVLGAKDLALGDRQTEINLRIHLAAIDSSHCSQ
jgi:hypothetical protein